MMAECEIILMSLHPESRILTLHYVSWRQYASYSCYLTKSIDLFDTTYDSHEVGSGYFCQNRKL